ncbi:MBL fold metallo-hydrolase [Pararhizobium antarcticum]|uniref:Metallo-beta-lactamase domain-containing protein n=1 Tax=Pararhizobium antarcticum TaxID=1798805 RepID=A0A657LXS9_9HYPH|nr:MBL fold metallo-hydrolase [Pararhizobium antarcticum]OJF89822.1 hypothetical protein AX761_07490 [Rhizobium sp. 58]OJF99771.1 hypothetical protein AX760_12005 [Pararhizobium antarcticum]
MAKQGNPYYQGPVSDHFDGVRFFNPGGEAPKGFRDVLRWQFGGGKIAWPKAHNDTIAPARPDTRIGGTDLRVTMVGHATLLIQVAGLNILTDPVWSKRASPFSFAGPRRAREPGIRLEDLPPIDVVLVTHNHYDHLDLATLRALHARFKPRIITPVGNDAIIDPALPDAEITTMDWGDGINVIDGVALYCEPCHHWSARSAFDRSMALWGAFVLTTPAGNIYHIGDTGFHDGINYRAVTEKYGAFRLANLPIGAYEPRWFMKAQHQNPDEAVDGLIACNAAYAIGHHWGMFRLTNEGMHDPLRALETALDEKGIARDRFQILQPGEAFEVPAL